jgi:hypothetical protein
MNDVEIRENIKIGMYNPNSNLYPMGTGLPKNDPKRREMLANYREDDNQKYLLFKEHCKTYFLSCTPTNFSLVYDEDAMFERAWEYAYREGHSEGYHSVFDIIEDLIAIIGD